jgi:CDP-glycerol glycerophosphotransferase
MEYGHPRNDVFFRDNTKTVSCVKSKFGIDSDTQILLYIPTYRDDLKNECYSVDFERVKKAIEDKTGKKWVVMIRLHPKLTDMAEKYIPESDFIIDATAYDDIQDILVSADAVITDYSSAVFDFMLSYKPAFIYAVDIEKYNNERGFYYDIHTTPFAVAVNNDELCQNISKFNYDEYKNSVKRFLKEKGSFEDGKASERVADLIERL